MMSSLKQRKRGAARALYSLSRSWHEMKIAKHKMKIAKAKLRYLERMERIGGGDGE
jgi:hypothetical protein